MILRISTLFKEKLRIIVCFFIFFAMLSESLLFNSAQSIYRVLKLV